MNGFFRTFVIIGLTIGLMACQSGKNVASPDSVAIGYGPTPTAKATPASGSQAKSTQPMARIYKIAPEYAMLVPVTVAQGQLVSFPAPTDISPATAPLPLADGWFLDRQGIGPQTSFLKWTREEYADFKTAPTPAEILSAVVPQARLQQLVELPVMDMSSPPTWLKPA